MNTQALWLNNFKYTFKNLFKHKILYFFVLVYIAIFLVFIVVLPISSNNELLSGWSVVENNNIAFIMIVSSGISGILVGFIFKETQDNNLDLIISTKLLSKRNCVIIKLLVFFITEIFISLLVIIIISCFLPLINGATPTHIFFLYMNIIGINVVFTLLFGGFALIVTNIGSKVLTVLSPIVLSMAITIYSIGVDMSKLPQDQQMMLHDNVQATTVKYFSSYSDPQEPTITNTCQTGVYFTSYNPNIQFSGTIEARKYYAKIQADYSNTDLYSNPIRQFALMSNSFGLVNHAEQYMSNSFGGTKITNYRILNLAYAYTARPPLMFVVGTQSADYNVFLFGNTSTSQKLLSNNIGFLYAGSANSQSLKEFDNYQLMPSSSEVAAFEQLRTDFNDNIAANRDGAFWNGVWPQGTLGQHVNEYEWLRYYFEDISKPFKVTNDYELNYHILQFKTYEWYKECLDFRQEFFDNVNNLSNYFKSESYYKSQWQLQTFAMTQLTHGIKFDISKGLFFEGSEYSMGFHILKLSLFQNVLFGFFDFTTTSDTTDFWLFDIIWTALGISLLSIGVILYSNKDFA